MIETQRHLDGNAVAGLLAQVFNADMTSAMCTCGTCGNTSPLAMAMVYPGGPAHVLRCAVCDSVVMKMAELPGRIVLEASGVMRMQFSDAS
ncbi:MAG TPA: DUF6510 family protein [Thermoleophilaceae bacterium]